MSNVPCFSSCSGRDPLLPAPIPDSPLQEKLNGETIRDCEVEVVFFVNSIPIHHGVTVALTSPLGLDDHSGEHHSGRKEL